MAEQNLPAIVQPTSLGVTSVGGRVNLDKIYAQMQAMNANNMGGGVGGSYSMQGKVKIDLQKTGMLTFVNPFTQKPDGGKSISVLVIDTKFQLQRWLREGETLPGYDPEKNKGPVCRSVQYTEPLKDEAGNTVINQDGWFYGAAFSPYHAVKMLPDLTGSGGHDGQQGTTLCSTCTFSQQNVKGKDNACKPAGMMEVVIFKVGDDFLPKPIYGVVKMSVTSIIAYADYLEQLKKVHGIGLAQAALTMIEAQKVVKGGTTFGKMAFHAIGRPNADVMAKAEAAIAETEAILASAKEAADSNALTTAGDEPF